MKKILLLILAITALAFSLSSISEEAKGEGEAMFEVWAALVAMVREEIQLMKKFLH